jgi:hypothetical protein
VSTRYFNVGRVLMFLTVGGMCETKTLLKKELCLRPSMYLVCDLVTLY